ncbi:MAG TPA: cysteine--tRNA ligase [Candidatus Dojkabacteria bacterium]
MHNKLRLYNSLGRKIENFLPNGQVVKMYTCGPTVYSYPTIGNWRTYILSDILLRTLIYTGHKVDFVMNLTDVGHLTGDNLGDADVGEDRMEKSAKKQGRSAWEIAEFYTEDFLEGFEKLNMIKPILFSKATDHISEQIEMVEAIEKKGFAYKIDDGIYFDTKKYEGSGGEYGQLSSLDEIKEGGRVKRNPQKRDSRDFALWKFSPRDEIRQMEWDSPWGKGFPGWHIECSAMSCKYLGPKLDIHVGGEDLMSTHHPNEIVQSEVATGQKPFSKFWVHGAFLLVDGGRMGKSLGNAFTIKDLEDKGFDSMDLRYFYLTGHYRKKLNFRWEALEAAKNARARITNYITIWQTSIDNDKKDSNLPSNKYIDRFAEVIVNDLNMPEALSVMWELAKSDLDTREKLKSIEKMDEVFGLGLSHTKVKKELDNGEVKDYLKKRLAARDKGDWPEADRIRDLLRDKYKVDVIDTSNGQEIRSIA